MNIKTKFDIGDKVYFEDVKSFNNIDYKAIVRGTVTHIQIDVFKDAHGQVSYDVMYVLDTVSDNDLYNEDELTKEEEDEQA
jgi:hypothetical protein